MSNAGIGLLIIRELVRAWKFRLSNYNKGFGRFQQRCHGMLYDMKSGDRHNIIFQMYKPPVLIIEYYNGLEPMKTVLMDSWTPPLVIYPPPAEDGVNRKTRS